MSAHWFIVLNLSNWAAKNIQKNRLSFNLYPEKWFEGYPVKSTQIFFRVAAWKKVGCHTYKFEKKSGEHPEKNLGRFYRVPFKSILRPRYRLNKQISQFSSWLKRKSFPESLFWWRTFEVELFARSTSNYPRINVTLSWSILGLFPETMSLF